MERLMGERDLRKIAEAVASALEKVVGDRKKVEVKVEDGRVEVNFESVSGSKFLADAERLTEELDEYLRRLGYESARHESSDWNWHYKNGKSLEVGLMYPDGTDHKKIRAVITSD